MTLHAKIHVGCKQLGIEEDDRREIYMRVTGKNSLTEMSYIEQKKVVKELERLGFKPSSKGSRRQLEGKYAKKLQALWIACWNLGLTRSKSDQSLLAFVKRQSGVDHTRFLKHKEDADKVIEALKGWLAREGAVDWAVGDLTPNWQRMNGAKIAIAQWHKIRNATDGGLFLKFVRENGGKPLLEMEEADWIPVMNALGREIRTEK